MIYKARSIIVDAIDATYLQYANKYPSNTRKYERSQFNDLGRRKGKIVRFPDRSTKWMILEDFDIRFTKNK